MDSGRWALRVIHHRVVAGRYGEQCPVYSTISDNSILKSVGIYICIVIKLTYLVRPNNFKIFVNLEHFLLPFKVINTSSLGNAYALKLSTQ